MRDKGELFIKYYPEKFRFIFNWDLEALHTVKKDAAKAREARKEVGQIFVHRPLHYGIRTWCRRFQEVRETLESSW
jgi:hypothetical protein